ncbi:hypothetical protein B0H19DRAFT_1234930 [Mycena capillaripes]|nr:hypothetical protein B0H19DRAFT_1234930 [Mycena capillaripes]
MRKKVGNIKSAFGTAYIRINSESATYDERILTACAKTLKYLAVDPGDRIHIPHLPLVLDLEMKVFVGNNRRLPAFFHSNFSQIASSLPLVETITLVFVVEPLFPEITWPDQGPLPVLDSSFASRMQLLHLQRVHCKLLQRSTFSSMSALFDRFVTAMESSMPGLQDTGILACTLAERNDSSGSRFLDNEIIYQDSIHIEWNDVIIMEFKDFLTRISASIQAFHPLVNLIRYLVLARRRQSPMDSILSVSRGLGWHELVEICFTASSQPLDEHTDLKLFRIGPRNSEAQHRLTALSYCGLKPRKRDFSWCFGPEVAGRLSPKPVRNPVFFWPIGGPTRWRIDFADYGHVSAFIVNQRNRNNEFNVASGAKNPTAPKVTLFSM